METVTTNCPECWNHVLVETDAFPGEMFECKHCGAISYVNWKSPLGLERDHDQATIEDRTFQDLSEEPPPPEFPFSEETEVYLDDYASIVEILDLAIFWDYKQIDLQISLTSQDGEDVKVVVKKLSPAGETIPERSENALDHYLEGVKKREAGLYEEAIAHYDEAIRLHPGFAKSFFGRGRAKAELGLYEEAIADYDETICLNPHDPRAYLSRGIVRSKLGVKDKARQDCQTALKLAQNAKNEGLVGKAKQEISYLDTSISPKQSH